MNNKFINRRSGVNNNHPDVQKRRIPKDENGKRSKKAKPTKEESAYGFKRYQPLETEETMEQQLTVCIRHSS